MTDTELQALVALMNSDISRMHAENAGRVANGAAPAYAEDNWSVHGATEVDAELVRRGILPD